MACRTMGATAQRHTQPTISSSSQHAVVQMIPLHHCCVPPTLHQTVPAGTCSTGQDTCGLHSGVRAGCGPCLWTNQVSRRNVHRTSYNVSQQQANNGDALACCHDSAQEHKEPATNTSTPAPAVPKPPQTTRQCCSQRKRAHSYIGQL